MKSIGAVKFRKRTKKQKNPSFAHVISSAGIEIQTLDVSQGSPGSSQGITLVIVSPETIFSFQVFIYKNVSGFILLSST